MIEAGCASIRLHRWCSALAPNLLLALLLAILLAAHLPARAQQAPNKQQAYRVDINGAGALASLLNEHLEIRRHESDPEITKEELQRLVDITPRQIRELLATEGYFSPTIDTRFMTEEGVPVARFDIRPGEPTLVSSVDIRFRGEIASGPHRDERRMERLRRQWALDPGKRFRQADWNDAKGTLLKNLLVRDFAAATIASSEARVDPERHSAALSVEVDSGPAFTFGELQVSGLQRYSRSIIDQLNPIRPGDPYSQEKLNELQSRLQDSGYFRSAFAAADTNPASPNNVPVKVDLQENPRKRLGLGVGFSTDAGARLQLKWLDRNFMGRNWRLDSALLHDRETSRLGATILLPALRNGWTPGFDGRLEHSDIAGEKLDTIRFGARLTSPVKTDEQVWGVSFLADRQRVDEAFANNRQALIGTYVYTRRRVDNAISPRRGYVASIEVDGGLGGLVNKTNIVRMVGNATWLSPIHHGWQAVLRAQAGEVFQATRLDVPADLLFRTGGDQSVRGYAYNSIGIPEAGAVVGGTVLAVVSAELVYWFLPQWGAAVFTDAGDATDSWKDMSLKRGAGAGVRWRSPIGPVNLDVAYGQETRKVRLHFTIGYGF